jgi:hypothetical protein
MPDEAKVKEAGALIKRAARQLADAGNAQTWDRAKAAIAQAATYLRRAGDELEG